MRGPRTEEPPRTTAAAPSVKELHMRRVSTPATSGRLEHLVDRRRALALGERVARRVAERLDGGGGDLADGQPDVLHAALGPHVVEAHEDAASRVVVSPAPLVQVVAVLRRQAVLDSRHRLPPVAGPHLLDAQGEHGAVRGGGGHGGQVQGRAPAGTRIVDVDDGGLAQSGLAQPGLPAHAALVAQAVGHGVPDDDEPEIVRGQAGVAQRLVHHLVGHRLGREVAPAHVGHAGAQNGDVVAAHAGTSSSWRAGSPPVKAACNRPKCSKAGEPATMIRMWRAPLSANRCSAAAQASAGPATRWRRKAFAGRR